MKTQLSLQCQMLRYETTLTIKDPSQSRWYNKYQHLDIKHCVRGQKLDIY